MDDWSWNMEIIASEVTEKKARKVSGQNGVQQKIFKIIQIKITMIFNLILTKLSKILVR